MKISIITITYNSEKTLEDTIQSVARQNYPDLEYIIVDGGSKDATLDIVKKYSNVVTKWISEPDKGISDAFNKGIKIASGELIGIINSDDTQAPVAMAYRLNNSCKSEKQMLIIRGAGHTDCYKIDPLRYENAVYEFIKNHIT